MKHIISYFLASLGGNSNPSSEDLAKILRAGGIDSDNATLETILKEFSGKNVDSIASEGLKKFASIPSGVVSSSNAPATSQSASSTSAASAAPAKEAPKKKEESEEEMGLGLFD